MWGGGGGRGGLVYAVFFRVRNKCRTYLVENGLSCYCKYPDYCSLLRKVRLLHEFGLHENYEFKKIRCLLLAGSSYSLLLDIV